MAAMPRCPRIVVPDDWPPVLAGSPAFQTLRDISQLEYHETLPATPERLVERIREADAVVNIRSSSRFTSDVFGQCPHLRLLSIWGTGTDNVDLASAAEHGVQVANTPGVSAYSVAEHALTLMLAAARRIPEQDAAVRRGEWPRGRSIELRGKVLGIIGLGAIGRRFAELGRAIGMHVVAWTLNPRPLPGIDLVTLDDLLRSSDVVSIHLRLSDQTRGLLGSREFALMKPTAILVNTGRGAIVDEAALIEALSTKRIAAAGLDVFTIEPVSAYNPLISLTNVVLTPHSAGITPEALEAGLQMAVENVRRFFEQQYDLR